MLLTLPRATRFAAPPCLSRSLATRRRSRPPVTNDEAVRVLQRLASSPASPAARTGLADCLERLAEVHAQPPPSSLPPVRAAAPPDASPPCQPPHLPLQLRSHRSATARLRRSRHPPSRAFQLSTLPCPHRTPLPAARRTSRATWRGGCTPGSTRRARPPSPSPSTPPFSTPSARLASRRWPLVQAPDRGGAQADPRPWPLALNPRPLAAGRIEADMRAAGEDDPLCEWQLCVLLQTAASAGAFRGRPEMSRYGTRVGGGQRRPLRRRARRVRGRVRRRRLRGHASLSKGVAGCHRA